MLGQTLDYSLNTNAILRHAAALFPSRPIVTRRPDRSLQRSTIGQVTRRALRLARALRELGVRPGDRVGTLCWNHQAHVEAYFGIPLSGGVMHTLNLRLHPDDLGYILRHGGARTVIVDDVLLPVLEKCRAYLDGVQIVVVAIAGNAPMPPGALDYEHLIGASSDDPWDGPDPDERSAAAMCYTTGTTGRPKGVVYSHRALAVHSLALCMTDTFGIGERDVVLPVVPMFHVNAWGLPYACLMAGASLVLPGPHLDAPSLIELFEGERVTFTAGVPTIWLGLLQVLDAAPGRHDLSSLRALLVGGSAAPPAMIRGFQERHGLRVVHAWGMTETAPLATIGTVPPDLDRASEDERYAARYRQGRPSPFIEIRARGEQGLVPWDGQSMGELEIRGPWIAGGYYNDEEAADRFTEDGWFRTGDIVTIDARGAISIQDRAKDLIKSGGEWIGSIALETALMGHPAVAEAAVIAVADEKWGERPLAAVVVKEGQQVAVDELRAFLAERFASWWVPDRFEFVAEIPRTSTGKFKKSVLRERFGADHA